VEIAPKGIFRTINAVFDERYSAAWLSSSKEVVKEKNRSIQEKEA
jgi:hypothetical protein